MGVERAVTRWYVQRQQILSAIASLEASLAQPRTEDVEGSKHAEQGEAADVGQQLAIARSRLTNLGPCPKPMMG